MKVERCDFIEVIGFRSAARRERVMVDAPPGTEYYCVREGGELVAFGALMIRQRRARLKADWTKPEHRGKGAHRAILAARLKEARAAGCRIVTAFCTPHSLGNYLAAGFAAVKKNANGIVFVEKQF